MNISVVSVLDLKLGLLVGLTSVSFAVLYIGDPVSRLVIWAILVVVGYLLCWYVLFSSADRFALLRRLRFVDE